MAFWELKWSVDVASPSVRRISRYAGEHVTVVTVPAAHTEDGVSRDILSNVTEARRVLDVLVEI